jgi:hypothetical protein
MTLNGARHVIAPNPRFIQQLLEFEEEIKKNLNVYCSHYSRWI